jgi:hypothetical protein
MGRQIMTHDCEKGPTLERIEKKLDTLTEVLMKQAVHTHQIDTLVVDVSDLKEDVGELETWRAKWGGAAIALGGMGSVLSGGLVILQLYKWTNGG